MNDSLMSRMIQQAKVVRAQRNKQIGRSYEQRILKQINAVRVPMSGAGSVKGDGLLQTPYGLAVLECKYRHGIMVSNGYQRAFTFNTAWINKLEKDVADMKAVFGILIMHLSGDRFHYGIIAKDVIDNTVRNPPDVYGEIVVDKTILIRTVGFLEPACRYGAFLIRTSRGLYYLYDLFYLLYVLGLDVSHLPVVHDKYISPSVVEAKQTGSKQTGSKQTGSKQTGSKQTGSKRTSRKRPDKKNVLEPEENV